MSVILRAIACLCLFALAAHAAGNITSQYCAPTDDPNTCANLVEIAQALNYQSWTFHRAWLSNTTYCFWDGINCASGSNVIILLDLSMNNIQGPLPPVIGTMHTLQHLSFAQNQLSGSLPDFISSLTNLNFLSLNSNQFTGSVPDSYSAFSQMVEFGRS